MKVRYKIGTNNNGNFKIRFTYTNPEANITIQEIHNLLCTADVQNVQEVIVYSKKYIRKLKARMAQIEDKTDTTEVNHNEERSGKTNNNKLQRLING